MKKSFYFLCFSIMLLPALVKATDGPENFRKGPNAAVKKYIKEQVMPVLLQKRQQFDAELSSTEKNEIAECRAALKQLRNQHHDWKDNGDNRPAPGNGKMDETENAPHPDFEQHKEIMQRLQAIADKHSNSLQDIKTQLEPARKQWIGDIKKLMPATEDAKSDDLYQGQKHFEHGPEGFPFAHHFAGVHFLLLSANPADQPEEELRSEIAESAPSPAVATSLTDFSIMPNPAVNDVQLGTGILPASNELKITDMQGKELLTLQNVQASQHLDVSQLASGTYLIQIKSGSQVVSKKVVVSK